jgi:hypothetical protein
MTTLSLSIHTRPTPPGTDPATWQDYASRIVIPPGCRKGPAFVYGRERQPDAAYMDPQTIESDAAIYSIRAERAVQEGATTVVIDDEPGHCRGDRATPEELAALAGYYPQAVRNGLGWSQAVGLRKSMQLLRCRMRVGRVKLYPYPDTGYWWPGDKRDGVTRGLILSAWQWVREWDAVPAIFYEGADFEEEAKMQDALAGGVLDHRRRIAYFNLFDPAPVQAWALEVGNRWGVNELIGWGHCYDDLTRMQAAADEVGRVWAGMNRAVTT